MSPLFTAGDRVRVQERKGHPETFVEVLIATRNLATRQYGGAVVRRVRDGVERPVDANDYAQLHFFMEDALRYDWPERLTRVEVK